MKGQKTVNEVKKHLKELQENIKDCEKILKSESDSDVIEATIEELKDIDSLILEALMV